MEVAYLIFKIALGKEGSSARYVTQCRFLILGNEIPKQTLSPGQR